MTATRVALTFDTESPDRPATGGGTERVLEALDQLVVPATFFVQGRWVEHEPDTATAIVAAGHLVGNHSHYHVRMPLLTPAGFDEDVREAARVIEEIVGVDPRPWFRLPFGAGMDDPAILGRLGALGYRNVDWDVDAMDWEPGATADSVALRILTELAAGPDDAIVLLHAWPDPVAGALGSLVPRLREAGATFVRVDVLALESESVTIPA